MAFPPPPRGIDTLQYPDNREIIMEFQPRSRTIPRPVPRGFQLPNHYILLQISAWASPRRIRRAYYDQLRRVHPCHYPREGQGEAFRACLLLRGVYQTLIGPHERMEYDRTIGFERPREFYFSQNKKGKAAEIDSNEPAEGRKKERQLYEKQIWDWKFATCKRPHRHYCMDETLHELPFSECGCESSDDLSSTSSDSPEFENKKEQRLAGEPKRFDNPPSLPKRNYPSSRIRAIRRRITPNVDYDVGLASKEYSDPIADRESSDADDELEPPPDLEKPLSAGKLENDHEDIEADVWDGNVQLNHELAGASRRTQPPPATQFRSRWSSSEEEEEDDDDNKEMDKLEEDQEEDNEEIPHAKPAASLDVEKLKMLLDLNHSSPTLGYESLVTNIRSALPIPKVEPKSHMEQKGSGSPRVSFSSTGRHKAPHYRHNTASIATSSSANAIANFRRTHPPGLAPVGPPPSMLLLQLPSEYYQVLPHQIPAPTPPTEPKKFTLKIPKYRIFPPRLSSEQGGIIPRGPPLRPHMHKPLRRSRSDGFCTTHRPNCRRQMTDEVIRSLRLRETLVFEEAFAEYNFQSELEEYHTGIEMEKMRREREEKEVWDLLEYYNNKI